MVSVPGTDKGIDHDKAPLKLIRKMNAIFKSLSNETPSIRIGPSVGEETKNDKVLQELPGDIDAAENRPLISINLYIPALELIVN